MDFGEVKTIDILGVPICYLEAGSGSPLVFVHGWTLNFTYWKPQIEFFSTRHRVIAMDWHGAGCSGGGREAYPFQSLIDEVGGVISALCGGEKPILIGHSLGGMICMQYAIEHADRLASLVVVDSALPHRLKEKLQLTLFALTAKTFGMKATTCISERLFWGKPYRELHPEAIAAWRKQYVSNSASASVNSLAAMSDRPDPISGLEKLRLKTLLVIGEHDAYVPQEDYDTLHQAIAGSRLVKLDAGHMSFVEQSHAFNETVTSFLHS